jgi:hypothetical protein
MSRRQSAESDQRSDCSASSTKSARIADAAGGRPAPRRAFVGTPEGIADTLQHWVDERDSDCFVLFEALPGQLDPLSTRSSQCSRRGVCFAPNMKVRPSVKKSRPFLPVNRHTAARLLGRREAVASPRQISKRKDNCVLETGRAIMWGQHIGVKGRINAEVL